MNLRLEVFLASDRAPKSARQVAVSGPRFRVGRGSDNDLTLPDPDRIVSNSHCYLEAVGESYVLVDTSTNGVAVNGSWIPKGTPFELSDGDEVHVGPHRLRVVLDATELALEDEEPFPTPAPAAGSGRTYEPTSSETPTADPAAPPELDPLQALGGEGPGRPAPERAERPASADHGPPLEQHMPAPRLRDEPSAAPDDASQDDIPEALRDLPWATPGDASDPFSAGEPPLAGQAPEAAPPEAGNPFRADPAPAPAPAPASVPGPGQPRSAGAAERSAPPSSGALGALFRGLGIAPGEHLTDQQLFELGRVVATLLDSFINALTVRSRFKAEIGVARTVIQSSDNNPIKLSRSAAEALQKMFVTPHKGYLGAVEAAEDAVADLAVHELAMFSALRHADRAMVEHLDPERLESEFQNRGARIGLGVLDKSRYWAEYKRLFERRLKEAEPVLQYFAEGYDRAVEELRTRESENSGRR